MTMVQCVVHPDKALVVSDSVCRFRGGGIVRNEDRSVYQDGKLIPLRGFLLTGLGSLDLRRAAERYASALDGLDACVEQLPQALRHAHRELGLRDLQTVLVVGWSEKNARISCAVFTAENDFEAEVHGTAANPQALTFWRNPDIPREPFAHVPDDRESLVGNAHATVRHWRQIDPATPIGGPLRLAEITRDAITLSIAGDLGVPITDKEDAMSSRTAIAAMALTLAACGGSEEPIEAGQLMPGSITVSSRSNYAGGNIGYTVTGTATVGPDLITNWTFTDTANSVLQIGMQVQFTMRGLSGTTSQFNSVMLLVEVFVDDVHFPEYDTKSSGVYFIDGGGDRRVELAPSITITATDAEILARTGVSGGHSIKLKRTATIYQSSGAVASSSITGDTVTLVRCASAEYKR